MNAQLEELACLYVLDRLDARERAAFEARLPLDPELSAVTREIEASLARRIHALPRHEPPADMLARIEARIDGLRAGETRRPSRSILPLWASVARWGIAAVIAVGVGIVAVQSLRRAPAAAARSYLIVVGLDSLRSTLAELPVEERPQNADASFIQLASLAERYWERPEDLPVKLDSAGGSGRGYALFDPGSNQGFIAIRQLPAAGLGKEYHLWLLDTASGQIREAGILPVAGSARGLYFFSVVPTTSARPGRPDFFVTAEDSGSPESAQPRGKVVLGDKRI
jgi:anti-sigma-K factor RskA